MESTLATLSPLVIDGILAVLILLVACIKAKIGFFQSVMKFVVIILAIAIGLVGSKVFLEPVSNFVWEKYGPIVETKFDNETGNAETEEKNDAEMAQKLKVYTLAKAKMVCDKVCKLVLFFLITAAALLILNIIRRIIGKLANFSVIGWINHGLGFLFGALEMVVILLLIIRGAGLFGIRFFANLSEGTVLLKWMTGGNVTDAFEILKNFSIDDFKNIDLKNFTTIDFKSVGDWVKDLIMNIDGGGQ